MGAHLVVLVATKLKFLAAGGHTNGHILLPLAMSFMLKLLLVTRMPSSLPGTAYSLRLLLFQLNSILFRGTPANRRMERTFRLLYSRMIDNGRSPAADIDAETLHALSMASL